MGGMDMTGFRMISTGFAMAMLPAHAPWSGTEFALTFAMWTVMMIGMMTPSAAPMILIYARAGRMASAAGSPLAATGWFAAARWFAALSRGLDRLCTCRDNRAISARTLRLARSGNGQRQQHPWRRPADRRWPLSMDAVETRLPVAVPVAAPVHRTAWRFPEEHFGGLATWRRARALLPWLLLGPDGHSVCRRRHERRVDRRAELPSRWRKKSFRPAGWYRGSPGPVLIAAGVRLLLL